MGIRNMWPVDWLISKAQRTPERYLESSIRVIEGSGTLGKKATPFNYQLAVDKFRSWVYAAAMLNAQAVSSVPLRLYVRKARGARKALFATRPVSRAQKAWLRGDGAIRPSAGVMQRAIEFADDFEEVVELHPAIEVLRRVNPHLNGFNLTTLRILYQELTGNAYLHPVIGQLGVPVELWPMPAQWVSVIPDREQFIAGYVYGQTTAEEQTFEPDEVIHFKYPNPDNLFYGKGKVEAGWGVINLQESKRVMDAAWFDNQARPDYAVIVKSGATTEQLDRFENQIQQKLKGRDRAGKFLTLTGNVELTPLNFPPKDLGDSPEIVEEIAGVFGVPVTKLKANDPNRANAETGDAGWLKDTILPLTLQDEEKLNEVYLPLFGIEGDHAFLAYDNPVPQNRQFELTKQSTLVTSGIMTINEARSESGMEPQEGGDVLRVNGQSLETLDTVQDPFGGFGGLLGNSREPAAIARPAEAIQPGLVAASHGAALTKALESLSVAIGSMSKHDDTHTDDDSDDSDDDGEPDVMEKPPEPSDKGKVLSHTKIMHDGHDCGCGEGHPVKGQIPTRLGEWMTKQEEDDGDGDAEDTEREGEPTSVIARMTREIAAILADMQASAIAEYEAIGIKSRSPVRTKVIVEQLLLEWRKNLGAIWDLVKFTLTSSLEPEIRFVLDQSGQRSLETLATDFPEISADLVGSVFDVTNQNVVEFIDTHLIRLTDEITAASLNHITPVVRQGISEGWTTRRLTQELASTGQFDRARAERIARTESATAYIEGEQLGWRQSGVVVGKEWLLAPNACEFCRAVAKSFNKSTLNGSFLPLGTDLRGLDGGTLKLDYRSITGPPLHPNCRCGTLAIID